MNVPKHEPIDEEAVYWALVRECLREFHRFTADAARRKAGRLRADVELMTKRQIELFYHCEPFDIACDLAKRPFKPNKKHFQRYVHMRDVKYGDGLTKQAARRPH